jgi:hypothetical protein
MVIDDGQVSVDWESSQLLVTGWATNLNTYESQLASSSQDGRTIVLIPSSQQRQHPP